MQHIGLFGGTFNPIHLGHLRAIQYVQNRFAIDKYYLIPAAIPPHKNFGDIVHVKYRLEMLQLAVAEHSDFLSSIIVSDFELKRSGPSYTIDTVKHFKSILPYNSSCYLILGIDAFLDIDSWKSYSDLFCITSFIVINRPTGINDDGVLKWQVLEKYIRYKISDNYKFSISRSCFIHNAKQTIYFVDVDSMDISSTHIRKLIKRGQSIKFLVPKKVEDFIISKGFYI